jgi:hypothetical protein
VREGKNGGEIDPTAPPPRSSLLHHPQPHVLLQLQRRAPATAAAAVSTGHREREEREIEGERRALAAGLLEPGGGEERRRAGAAGQGSYAGLTLGLGQSSLFFSSFSFPSNFCCHGFLLASNGSPCLRVWKKIGSSRFPSSFRF